MTETIIILAVLAFSFYVGAIYNRVVKRKNETDQAFGTIEILLKKRYDLLPNLVELTKKYALFEANMYTEIVKLSNRLESPLQENERLQLHNDLNRNLLALYEKSQTLPELKTSQHFLKLQAAWNETEEQISAARRYYNTSVKEYINAKQTFPANFLVNPVKFPEKNYLEFGAQSHNNPDAHNLFLGSNA
jgi:LemA protein